MRKYHSLIVDSSQESGLKRRLEEGIEFLAEVRKTPPNDSEFMALAQKLLDVAKDLGVALTGREAEFSSGQLGVIEGSDQHEVKAPLCACGLSLPARVGEVLCSCGETSIIKEALTIGSRGNLVIVSRFKS